MNIYMNTGDDDDDDSDEKKQRDDADDDDEIIAASSSSAATTTVTGITDGITDACFGSNNNSGGARSEYDGTTTTSSTTRLGVQEDDDTTTTHNVHIQANNDDDDAHMAYDCPANITILPPNNNQDLHRIVRQVSTVPPPHDFTFSHSNTNNTTTDTTDSNSNNTDTDITDTDGSITLIHLSCICDNAFALAVLLLFGGGTAPTTTTIRHPHPRSLTVVHEACCYNSVDCLRVLLEMERLLLGDVRSNYNYNYGGGCSFGGVLTLLQRAAARLMSGRSRCGDDGTMTSSSSPQQQPQQQHDGNIIMQQVLHDIIVGHKLVVDHPSMPFTVPLETQLLLQNLTLQTDGQGNTPLHWSAFKNSADCLALLLHHHNTTHTTHTHHHTHTDTNNHPEGEEDAMLTMTSPPPPPSNTTTQHIMANARSHQTGWTPLHDAAYSNSTACIHMLLQHGANIHACANSGATPLCFAAQEDATEAVECLLGYGAVSRVGLVGSRAGLHRFGGYTPLHYAAHYNAAGSARALLRTTTTVMTAADTTTSSTTSSSSNAATDKCRQDLMNAMDVGRRLPIHIAVARGSSDVLRELLAAGASLIIPPIAPLLRSPHTGYDNTGYANNDNDNDNDAVHVNMLDDDRHPTMHNHNLLHVLQQRAVYNNNNYNNNHHHVLLSTLIPTQPIRSSRPWNCLTQHHIDACRALLKAAAEDGWTPRSHCLFTPLDRSCVKMVWMCGKFRAVGGVRLCMDLWRLVLGFCARGWFDHDCDCDFEHDYAGSSIRNAVPPVDHEEEDDGGSQQLMMELP